MLSPNQLVFIMLAGIAMLASVGVVAFNNPVRSALSLVVNFFVLAFIYFTLGAQLLGITQILVYTGAIMVLFLFVIMLLNLGSESARERFNDKRPIVALLLGLAAFIMIAVQVLLPLAKVGAPRSDAAFGTPQAIGKVLFTNYAYPFEIASVLLLVGIVGSIMLAKRRL